jgi:hypothetical protein
LAVITAAQDPTLTLSTLTLSTLTLSTLTLSTFTLSTLTLSTGVNPGILPSSVTDDEAELISSFTHCKLDDMIVANIILKTIERVDMIIAVCMERRHDHPVHRE